MIKKLLFVIFALASFARADDYAMYFSSVGTATGAASSSAQKQIGTSVAYHKLAWNKSGTVSKCEVVVEQSATGTSGWTDLVTAQTCTSNGTSTIFGASANYVRITFSTPVTGTGSVTASYSGYINLPLTDPPLFASWTAKAFVYSNALKQAVTTAAPTDGQILIGKTGDVPVLGSVAGTTNQITSTPGAGTITLSTPQDIATTSTPQFARLGAGQAADATAPFAGTIDSATTNTILDVLKLTRSTTGTAGNGIGTGLVLYAEDASGNIEEAGRFQASFPNATHATQTGRVDITVMGLPGGSLSTAGSTAWGVNAGVSNSGAYQTATGEGAGYSNTGASQTVTGNYAGYYNSGANQTATGLNAGRSNTEVNQTATGLNAGVSNTGADQTATGNGAGYNNSGAYQTGTGAYAGYNNTGVSQTATGFSAGQYNSGANQTATGLNAGRSNTGAYQTAIGVSAGRSNNWPNITRIGYQSSVYFPDDAGSLKNITEASITAADTITYVAHGFGTPSGKVNVRYLLTGGTAPVGLVHGTIYQFTVTSADVLTLSGIAFPAAAFTGTLNNSTDTSNSIAIGVDANPTKANQAVLGPSSITETLLRGNVGIGTAAPAEKHHVYNGNSRIDYGHLKFVSEATPGAPTSNAPTAGGSCTAGTHVFVTTFVTGGGETQYGAASAAQTCGANATVPLSAIPTGTSSVTTGRNICASKAGTTTPLYQVGASPTIADNSTTTYDFVTADGSLTVACSTTNTTTGRISVNGVDRLFIDPASTYTTLTGVFLVTSNLNVLGGIRTYYDIKAKNFNSDTNCADGTATPADCGSAAAGAVIISAAATSVVVNTTAVTATSRIMVTRDNSLGTELSVTCNTQSDLVLGTARVTAKTAATSFTIAIDVAPTTDPACYTYLIFN